MIMKYKVGDKVKVKSREWYNKNKNKYGTFICNNGVYFQPTMSKFCENILIIKDVDKVVNAYKVEGNDYYWVDDMFEGLVKEKEISKDVPNKICRIFIFDEDYQDKVEICLGNDYEIVVENGRTFVQRKKPKYPTTYEECCQHLGCDDKLSTGKLVLFQQLINARNAYWKIAGEEMGLGKPWKFENPSKHYVFTIEYSGGNVILNAVVDSMQNRILVFPTEEMRDAFYENFKDLIEQVIELL